MRIGIFDLETSNLNANFGVVLCGVVKEYGPRKKSTIHRMDALSNYKTDRSDDSAVVAALYQELVNYDIWVSYNGRRFDIPFLNTRLMAHGLETLEKRKHIDLLYQARYKLKLHSARLASVQEFLGLRTSKTVVDGRNWTRAMAGYKDGWDYIVDHCVRDVKVLEEVYEKMKHFVTTIYA
jgi:uncharacterized protein YprB with RNaseH-like and TPR domain